MQGLNGKVFWISGGAGGIGTATGKRLLEAGARVFLADRSDEVFETAKTLGDGARAGLVDVTDADAVKKSVQEAVDAFGRLDGLHLNAGTEGNVAPLAEFGAADFQKVLDVNVLGVLYGLQAGFPHLKDNGGSVVITSSVAGLQGTPGMAAYGTSKHAVIGLMRTAAIEWGEAGIRVNTVNPGPIDNRMMDSIEKMASPGEEDTLRSQYEGQIPLNRYGRSEEIASMVAFLLSSEASYANGNIFVVDGGMRA